MQCERAYPSVPRNKKTISSKHLRSDDLVALALDRIATILLRAGLDAPRAESLLRRAFISAASRMPLASRRMTQSQVATIAGVSRLEVRKTLAAIRYQPNVPSVRESSRVSQLVQAWRTDKRFMTRDGKPRPLKVNGPNSSFGRLVRIYGRDVTKRTLRDQLVRLGLAKELAGELWLNESAHPSRNNVIDTADLRFVASQLKAIDFAIGRRVYTTRQISVTARNKKSVLAFRQTASGRLETVLNSLESMSSQADRSAARKTTPRHRLLVTATVATESDETE
jgi:hypothetical protein